VRVTRKLQAYPTFGGMGLAGRRGDIGRAGGFLHRRKLRSETMHNTIVSLLFVVMVMFPCFLSAASSD
jgi:hypothetical protein